MSYRTVVEGVQIFGNNEYYEKWVDFIKSCGIDIKEGGCYEGDITDVEGMFKVIDSITKDIIEEQHKRVAMGETTIDGDKCREMTDFSKSMWLSADTPILMFNKMIIEQSYAFFPYVLFLAVKGKIVPCERYKDDKVDWSCCSFKVREGEKIHIRAS